MPTVFAEECLKHRLQPWGDYFEASLEIFVRYEATHSQPASLSTLHGQGNARYHCRRGKYSGTHLGAIGDEVVLQVLGDLQQHDAPQLGWLQLAALQLIPVDGSHQPYLEARLPRGSLRPVLPSRLREGVLLDLHQNHQIVGPVHPHPCPPWKMFCTYLALGYSRSGTV